MSNQSKVGIDKKYPPRWEMPDLVAQWTTGLHEYPAPIHPDFETIQERLAAKGVEVPHLEALKRLGALTTSEAVEEYGEAIARVRHPLGRTGINGTGIFYEAGPSRTADIAVMRRTMQNLELALVYNRGKWRLPGGFIDPADNGDLRNTAIREGEEELGIPLAHLANEVETIVPEGVKPNSSRSVDMAYIMHQVELVVLPDPEMGDDIKANDDAEEAGWFTPGEVAEIIEKKQMSRDPSVYALLAFSNEALD